MLVPGVSHASSGGNQVVSPYSLGAKPTYANDKMVHLRYVNFNTKVLASLHKTAPAQLTLRLPLPTGILLDVSVERTSIISSKQRIRTTGNVTVEVDRGVHYATPASSNGKLLVAVSLFQVENSRYQFGGIVVHQGLTYVIGPDSKGVPVIFPDAELPGQNPFTCHSDELPALPTLNASPAVPSTPNPLVVNTVKLFIEADFKAYTDNGSSVATTVAWINTVWNIVGTLYNNIGVPIEVVDTYVNTRADNYPTSASNLTLNAWVDTINNRREYEGNLAHLLSTKNTSLGGIAYVDVVCNPTLNAAFSNCDFTFANLPTYSWTIMVIAHEMGHNMSSKHTQWCGWQKSPGVFGIIDSCYTAENAGSGVCYTGPRKPRVGTIMSYCHLNGSINLALGFGPLPSAKILNAYTVASCLTASTSSAPVITSFTPSTASSGQAVNITGTNFSGATSVKFGGVNAASFILNGSNSIQAVVGAGASGAISITTPNGTGSRDGFTYSSAPAPLGINSFSPLEGPTGEKVRIRGTALSVVQTVYFNNTVAPTWTRSGDTLITAILPSGATAGQLGVSAVGSPGTIKRSAAWFYPSGDRMLFRSFSPTSGRVGDTVRLFGRKMTPFTAVRFNGALCAFAQVRADTVIKTVIPNGATTGTITISNTLGQSIFSPTPFTVVLPPKITSFSPIYGAIGERVRLRGTGFSRVRSVFIGNTQLTQFAASGDTLITVIVSAGSGSAQFGVSESTGQGSTGGPALPSSIQRSAVYFQFYTSAFIRSFSPEAGTTGDTVILKGRLLTSYGTVRFNGARSAYTLVQGDSLIRAVVPTGSSTGRITASNASNVSTSSLTNFTFLPPPILSSFTPTSGPVGDRVRLRGSGLRGVKNVYFGAVKALDWATSGDTLLTVIVPAGAVNSRIAVNITQQSPAVFASQTGSFYIVTTAPIIRRLQPSIGTIGDTVRIIGIKLANIIQTRFSNNALQAPFMRVVNDTLVKTVVPVGAATGLVRVINTTFSFANSPTNFIVTLANGAARQGDDVLAVNQGVISLQPNPTRGETTLLVGEVDISATYTVSMHSTDGRTVYKTSILGNQLQGGTILPAMQTPGMYLIRIVGNTSVKSIRLVVE